MCHSPVDDLLSILDCFSDDLMRPLERFLEADARRAKRRRLAGIETGLEQAMAKAFRRQGKLFVTEFGALRRLFQESIAPADWIPLLDSAFDGTQDLFASPIEAAAAAALEAGWSAGATDLAIGTSFNLRNPRAVAYLHEYGARQVTKINDTTREYIKTVVEQGVDEGWSYDRMAKAITERYSEFAVGKPQAHIDSRAHLIAVTEAGEAYEHGNLLVAQDLADNGIAMQKHWLTVGDSGVDPDICRANEDQGWIPLAQPYQSGHDRPLGHPACRCTQQTRRTRAA
jgi:hypothetical protein